MTDSTDWLDRLRRTLACFDEGLLRPVATRLCRPRNQWPAEELIDRCLTAVQNPAVLDRRLLDLAMGSRRLLALIALSGQPSWAVGNLVELAMALGEEDGLQPVRDLLEAGLAYPELSLPSDESNSRSSFRLKSLDSWLTQGNTGALRLFAVPLVLERALDGELTWPEGPKTVSLPSKAAFREADGLDWPLRLAAIWQQVLALPLRRIQSGDFFKRDLDRLRSHPLLTSLPADHLTEVQDPGLLAVALGLTHGLLREEDGEIRAASFSPAWEKGLAGLLKALWAAFPLVSGWNAANGWQPGATLGNPYPSANLLGLLILRNLPEDAWISPEAIDHWVVDHHPYWTPTGKKGPRPTAGVATFLLGIAHPLRVLQATQGPDGWLVRLSSMGRWLLGKADKPPEFPVFPQTLLVQPNLEILAYRQGLTPGLIARLTRLAAWKTLGSACTLQLEPETVYRALEAGETFESIVQALEQHGIKALPVPVIESLRTWANKRERISVWPGAALFEFSSPADLNEALARGLTAVRLTDRLAAVANEGLIEYKHFRLLGTRDYGLPPEPCVEVEADGVTLGVDAARADLLLETELLRFTEPLLMTGSNGRRRYRLTPATLEAGRQQGLNSAGLDSWFRQRTGGPLSPAGRLLLTAGESPPVNLERMLVLQVSEPEIADGLQQWPGSRELIQGRLGPNALLVAEENAPHLEECLKKLGMDLRKENGIDR